jgi:phage tail-like protein
MPSFPVNPHRFDPYKVAKFQLILEGKTVPGVSKISGLRRETDVIKFREGAFPSYSSTAPGNSRFEPIVIERGITHDSTFEEWAEQAYSPQGDGAMSLRNFRKDLRISLLNQQGRVVSSYMIYRAWVSKYQALPELDANTSAVAIESIELEYEGFERDRAVTEPDES